MSDAKRFDRRSLFDVFRRAIEIEPPLPKTFSIEAFYERRAGTGANLELPRFSLREGLASVETTDRGAGKPS